LKPSVSNRLLYDEDIKVMIVTSPNSRLDFLVKMDEALLIDSSRERITIKEDDVLPPSR
jgi:hypothetical protein